VARKRTSDKPAKPTKPAAKPKSAAKPKAAPAKAAKGDTVFRLKITLDRFTPAIWRRVEVPDCTLEDLHDIIQVCMPWENYHLWEFSAGKRRFGPEMEDDGFDFGFGDESEPAHEVHLSDLVKAGVKKLRYTYDFGDSWEHTVAFEKPVARDPQAKYPRCVAGERAGPPEDCGGVWGYANLLEILGNPKHPEHEERLEWTGGPIDPEAFDLDETNKYLQKLNLK
jgi:hypothetical protein